MSVTMSVGGRAGAVGCCRTVTLEEVRKHNKRDDKWLVINGKAYDITHFAKRHPGGAKVISHYAGEDASVSRRNDLSLSLSLTLIIMTLSLSVCLFVCPLLSLCLTLPFTISVCLRRSFCLYVVVVVVCVSV